MPIPRPPGRPRHPEELTRQFQWAIRHYLGGESKALIAETAGYDRSVVSKAIASILTLLPEDPTLVEDRFRKSVVALLDASQGLRLPPKNLATAPS